MRRFCLSSIQMLLIAYAIVHTYVAYQIREGLRIQYGLDNWWCVLLAVFWPISAVMGLVAVKMGIPPKRD